MGLAVREDPQNLLGLIEAGMSTYVTPSASIAQLIEVEQAAVKATVVGGRVVYTAP